ncbi:hypothetical protein ONZ51_g13105 [Trametes cubensis]|uniref:tRNA (adenine(58)-N(1))-methyltransferase catalytic subunit TRM61 n=1 Tax=Trametes cubensis TaxID=1111947 RepID=A0AAD7TEM8_9APHY|nr:hypothetical protein ONZ51_g13105 [Trametes cubensis]
MTDPPPLPTHHRPNSTAAGTGSGSFSHSVARTIGPRGHLWSYEFHETRANKASPSSTLLCLGVIYSGPPGTHVNAKIGRRLLGVNANTGTGRVNDFNDAGDDGVDDDDDARVCLEEFTRHGMDDVVTLTHRNVCKEGFTVVDTVDAVFLDLPAPWDAVEHAKKALRKDRATRICCFSPCMEQVLRTVSALNEAGFTVFIATHTEITMYETLLRPHQVDTTPALEPIGAVAARLKQAEARREEKRLRQIAHARLGIERRAAKRKAGEEEDDRNVPPFKIIGIFST